MSNTWRLGGLLFLLAAIGSLAGGFTPRALAKHKDGQPVEMKIEKRQKTTAQGAMTEADAQEAGKHTKVYEFKAEPGAAYNFDARGNDVLLRLKDSTGVTVRE